MKRLWVILFVISSVWGQTNKINNNTKSYDLPVRIDLMLGAGQLHYIDLNPKNSVFAYAFQNDICGSVFFDELDKEFF